MCKISLLAPLPEALGERELNKSKKKWVCLYLSYHFQARWVYTNHWYRSKFPIAYNSNIVLSQCKNNSYLLNMRFPLYPCHSLHQKVALFMPLSEKITINISFTEMCLQQFSYFLISSFLAAKLDQNLSPKDAAEIICQFYTLFRVMVFSQKIFHDILRIGNDTILSRIFKENLPNWISELGPLIQATIYNTRHSTQKWL